jgi:hypothetical protein
MKPFYDLIANIGAEGSQRRLARFASADLIQLPARSDATVSAFVERVGIFLEFLVVRVVGPVAGTIRNALFILGHPSVPVSRVAEGFSFLIVEIGRRSVSHEASGHQ